MMQHEEALNSRRVTDSLMAKIKTRRENPADIYGYSWSFPTLDYMTGGIQTGLTVLGAETGAGKSLIGGQIAQAVAQQFLEQKTGQVVRVIHCEMTAEQFKQRLLAQLADVNERKLRNGRLTDEEYERVRQAAIVLRRLPIEYLEDPTSIEETTEFIRRGGNCGWFLVDHAQSHSTDKMGMSTLDPRHIGELAGALGHAAKNISGMLLSQLTNDVGKREDHRPTKSDLYGAKGLQQPASLILLLYRPDVYQPPAEDKKNEPRTAHLYIDKNRWTSDVGDVKLIWHPAKGVFVDAGFKSEQQKAA